MIEPSILKEKNKLWWYCFMVGVVAVGLDRRYELRGDEDDTEKRANVGKEAVEIVNKWIELFGDKKK